MPLTPNALLTLFPLEELPACDEGMALAARYLDCCLHAVAALDTNAAEELHTISLARWRALTDHHNTCDKCNEV